MSFSPIRILIVAAAVASLVSCGKKGKVISRGDMAEIYAEMFVMDQRIADDREARGMADTTLVYEPIFRKYGYTSDDYRNSMAYYLKDPDRYARILRESTVILEDKLKELRAEKARLESISEGRKASAVYLPDRIFFLCGLANKDLLTADSLSFYIDSTGCGSYMFDVQKGYDTVYVGPQLKVAADSSAVDTSAVSAVVETEEETLEHVRKAVPAGSGILHEAARPAGEQTVKSTELSRGQALKTRKVRAADFGR